MQMPKNANHFPCGRCGWRHDGLRNVSQRFATSLRSESPVVMMAVVIQFEHYTGNIDTISITLLPYRMRTNIRANAVDHFTYTHPPPGLAMRPGASQQNEHHNMCRTPLNPNFRHRRWQTVAKTPARPSPPRRIMPQWPLQPFLCQHASRPR